MQRPRSGRNREKASAVKGRGSGEAVSTMRPEDFQVLNHAGLGRGRHSEALAFISDATGSPR